MDTSTASTIADGGAGESTASTHDDGAVAPELGADGGDKQAAASSSSTTSIDGNGDLTAADTQQLRVGATTASPVAAPTTTSGALAPVAPAATPTPVLPQSLDALQQLTQQMTLLQQQMSQPPQLQQIQQQLQKLQQQQAPPQVQLQQSQAVQQQLQKIQQQIQQQQQQQPSQQQLQQLMQQQQQQLAQIQKQVQQPSAQVMQQFQQLQQLVQQTPQQLQQALQPLVQQQAQNLVQQWMAQAQPAAVPAPVAAAVKDVEMEDASKTTATNAAAEFAAYKEMQRETLSQITALQKQFEEIKEQRKADVFVPNAQAVADHLGVSKDYALKMLTTSDPAIANAIMTRAMAARTPSTPVGAPIVDTSRARGPDGKFVPAATAPKPQQLTMSEAERAKQNFDKLQRATATAAAAAPMNAPATDDGYTRPMTKSARTSATDTAAGHREPVFHNTTPVELTSIPGIASSEEVAQILHRLEASAKAHPNSHFADSAARESFAASGIGF